MYCKTLTKTVSFQNQGSGQGKITYGSDNNIKPGLKNSSLAQAGNNQQAASIAGPTISLPKGGGAIQGIGEKFAANPMTGTASFSVPIYTSPGRSGFGPQLSLSYDSGNGNGPFGFGWALSLPAITRKTDKGLPKYHDSLDSDGNVDDEDVFILSGSEDLVPAFKKNEDGSWATDADGNYVIDDVHREGYVVRTYRPRTEGLFARIERWMQKANGDIHWRSISKDNILTVYGRDKRSRIVDPSDNKKIFSWLICESYDDKGNAIVYKYASENGNAVGVLSQANEHNRQRTSQKYIKRILYGNKKPLLIDVTLPSFRKSHIEPINFSAAGGWMFEVVFDYGEGFDYSEGHYTMLPLEENIPEQRQHRYARASAVSNGDDVDPDGSSRKWPVRPDPFSSYRSGFEVRTYRRCHRVLMFHNFSELGEEPYLVRSTEFDYSDLDYSSQENGASISVETELEHEGSTRIASFITKVIQSGYVLDEAIPNEVVEGIVYKTYLKKSLPPLEFDYSKPSIHKEVKELDPDSLENIPIGLDGSTYQWTDLDGEGISGILARHDGGSGGGWFYKRNQGGAKFGPLEKVDTIPSLVAGSSANYDQDAANLRFLDLAGDGKLDAVLLGGGSIEGFYERQLRSPYRREENGWHKFRTFLSTPNLNWNDQNLQFVDLTGDGHSDILLTTEDGAFTWYLSLAEEGFGEAEKVIQSLDEEEGPPRLIFNDGMQSIFLADMSGDGLSDLVRIRNGQICYWPNLGYGRFGNKVTMDNSPWFDAPDVFITSRIRLADIDGTGVTDIVYVGGSDGGFKIYFNQSGNGWSNAYTISNFPAVDDSNLSSVQVLDFLGSGTACAVWSSSLPGNSGRQMRYIDLLNGKKPHLLVVFRNNLGAETHVHYSTSTRFYLEDRANGEPWFSRLPFPVHVVEKVLKYDYISSNLFVTKYAYHHGYFDGEEREFRGFGRVDQWDTEQFAALSSEDEFLTDEGDADNNIDISSHVPPVHIKTWFHTGKYIGRNHLSDYFAGLLDGKDKGEYYREPAWEDDDGEADEEASKYFLNDTIIPAGLTTEEERQACRALKGMMLRQEVYGLDGSSEKEKRPYTVTEQNFSIRLLQPQGRNRHAVFLTHGRETVSYQYERNPADPRVSHELMLEVDDYGNILKQAAIGYGRRQPDMNLPSQADRDKQTDPLVTYTENRFTNPVVEADSYRVPLSYETSTYELTGYTPSGPAGRFRFKDFVILPDPDSDDSSFRHDFDDEINYEDESIAGIRQRRLIEKVRTMFRRNDLTDLLPLGELHSMALQGDSYKLAFTPGLLSKIYQRSREDGSPESLLPDAADVLGSTEADGGGYVQSQELKSQGYFPVSDPDDHWWVPAGRIFYSPDRDATPAEELAYAAEHFFTPLRHRDPFENSSLVTMDEYDLMMVETEDPMENRITAGERNESGALTVKGNDYRTLQPLLMMDANRNRAGVTFDVLGMVVVTAVMGKPPQDGFASEGDSLEGFGMYDANLTDDELLSHLGSPLASAHAVLNHATTRLIYDLFAYYRTREDVKPQPSVVYTIARETHESDLAEREERTETKVQLNFSYSDGFGREIQKKVQAEPGRLDIYDPNSPILDPRWVGSGWTIYNNKGKPVRKYEPFFSATHRFEFAHIVGVSPILFYDPLERVVATLHPNHTYEKVVFDPWHQETWDVNDTVSLRSDNDADIRGFFVRDDGTLRLPADLYTPAWYALREDPAFEEEASRRWPDRNILDAQRNAAEKTRVHENSPTTVYLDTLGRTFLTVAHNKWVDENSGTSETHEEKYLTRINLDIEGNQREVIDAKGRIVMRYGYDMLGNRIKQESMDAGTRWMLNDVAGQPIRAWDSRMFKRRFTYDKLRRPTKLFVAYPGIDGEPLVEETRYGESQPDAEATNHRQKVWQVRDGAGMLTNESYDFKGNLLRSTRRLLSVYRSLVDWDLDPQPEDETFSSSTLYDALNRPIQIVAPHSNRDEAKVNVVQHIYNEANLLEHIDVWLEQTSEPDGYLDHTTASLHSVKNIDYDEKGQRRNIEYGMDVETHVWTTYEYDKDTFRLVHMKTQRKKDDGSGRVQLQDLYYIYDPVGNIAHIHDRAQQDILVKGRWVEPSTDYVYDATYRLKEAIGREHLGVGAANLPEPTSHTNDPRVGLNLDDPNFLGSYLEKYTYDHVGNIEEIDHAGTDPSHPGWTRSYSYDEDSLLETDKKSNRLSSTAVRDTTYSYKYDTHGNMTIMPHLAHQDPANPNMHWDFNDQLQRVDLDGGGTAYYVYDAGGQRVRKVHQHRGALIEERIYIGNFEVYRRRSGQNVLERETLHLMDDRQRVAMVETRTIDTQESDESPRQLVRYQFGNHLGSTCLELDQEAKIISYEEYYPYGSTSYQAMWERETPKRYRYTAKERDEETGLNYHGARYYALWLGRWISTDPMGLVDGDNLYHYVRNMPSRLLDNLGTQSQLGPQENGIYLGYRPNPRTLNYRNVVQEGGPDIDYARVQLRHMQEFLTHAGRRRGQELGLEGEELEQFARREADLLSIPEDSTSGRLEIDMESFAGMEGRSWMLETLEMLSSRGVTLVAGVPYLAINELGMTLTPAASITDQKGNVTHSLVAINSRYEFSSDISRGETLFHELLVHRYRYAIAGDVAEEHGYEVRDVYHKFARHLATGHATGNMKGEHKHNYADIEADVLQFYLHGRPMTYTPHNEPPWHEKGRHYRIMRERLPWTRGDILELQQRMAELDRRLGR